MLRVELENGAAALHARVFEARGIVFSNAARAAGIEFAAKVSPEVSTDPLGNSRILDHDEIAVTITSPTGNFDVFWDKVHRLSPPTFPMMQRSRRGA